MKEFKDLEFKPHPTGIGGERAVIKFNNGYGASVLFGSHWYSNGIDTYEVAVLDDGDITYATPITDDVLGYISKSEVDAVLIQIQELT